MGLFQTKKIQLLIILIIAFIAIIWIFQENYLNAYNLKKLNNQTVLIDASNEVKPYLEKIENFAINEYSDNEKIMYSINADKYFSYKNSPIELLEVELKTFDDLQKEGVIMLSKRAKILDSGEIIFNGSVNIETLNNIYHEIDSDSLTFHSKIGTIESNSNVLYQGERAKINAKGMLMNIDNDNLLLKDSVSINHESGSIIDTSNLSVNHSSGEKIYSSETKTFYRSFENEITAESGLIMDMNKNLTNLLGEVNMLEKSGTKIKTSNLLIDNSNDREIYETNQTTEYISEQSYIKSNKMYYDVFSKKINLSGDIFAVYE